MKKRLLLVIIIALALAGCGRQAGPDTPKPGTETEPADVAIARFLLQDDNPYDDPMMRLVVAKGGFEAAFRFIEENAGNPEWLSRELETYGLTYRPGPSAPSDSDVGIQAITDCEPFFPPEDRNRTHILPNGRQIATIDALGRPVSTSIFWPPFLPGARDNNCQQKVGNLWGAPYTQPDLNGGHLIGTSLGGYGRRANLVPQDANFNQVLWNRVEAAVRSCRNMTVNYTVSVSYPDNGLIPSTFSMQVVVARTARLRVRGIPIPLPRPAAVVRATFLNQPGGGPNGQAELNRLREALRRAGCSQRAVGLVVDDTGSMGPVIGAVRASLSDYIASAPEDPDITTTWNLTTFKDDVFNRGNTTDRSVILGQVSSLFASGGGDCPENVLGGIRTSMSAMNLAPDMENAPKEMVVVTDASAQPGDVEAIIATAQETDVRISVLLTGDCGIPAPARVSVSGVGVANVSAQYLSSQVILKRIAEETGGKFYYIPGGGFADFKAALAEIFAEIENPPPTDTTPPTVTVKVTPDILWPPNHKMVTVTPIVTAQDDQDPSPSVEFVGVRVSELDDGQGDGNTVDDVQIGTGGQIQLRAERSGKGNKRVYTITYKATDASGNIGYGSADVIVPKSQGN